MADTKQDVLDMLRELAELTMLDEGDPQSFRVRAYESAAQAIEAQATDLGELTAKELQKIDGIGKSTAAKIRELLETGKVAEARGAARRSTRRAWWRSCASRASGRRRVKRLRAELGVQSIDDLRQALAEHKLRDAQGLRAEVRGEAGRVAGAPRRAGADRADADLGGAARWPTRIVARLLEVPGVTHASYCGSLRRFSETIGDVDVVVAASDAGAGDGGARLDERRRARARPRRGEDQRRHPPRARRSICASWRPTSSAPRASTSRARRATTSSCASARSPAAGRSTSTRSPRSRAARSIASETEEQIYAALGLPWIPPVLREDAGEIEAAEKGALPAPDRRRHRRLPRAHVAVRATGSSSLEEVVAAAKARGYRVLAITDHAEGTLSGVGREALLEQRAKIRALQARARRLAAPPPRRRAEHRPARGARLRRRVPARLRLVPRLGARPLRARSRRADRSAS